MFGPLDWFVKYRFTFKTLHSIHPKYKLDMSFIFDYSITKFQINQDSVEVWKLLNRYIVQWDGISAVELCFFKLIKNKTYWLF
jgi:hypothetical protein